MFLPNRISPPFLAAAVSPSLDLLRQKRHRRYQAKILRRPFRLDRQRLSLGDLHAHGQLLRGDSLANNETDEAHARS